MARIALNCSCGWNFFIPGSTPGHEVTCPSCAQTVRIPGRKPGKDMPMSAGEIAAQVNAKNQTVRMLVGGGIVVVLIGIIAIVVSVFGGSKPEEITDAPSKHDRLTGFGQTDKNGRPVTTKTTKPPEDPFNLPPPPKDPGPGYSGPQIDELRRGVYSNIWLINMSAIISECMRYRNLTNEWGQLQADIANYDSKVKYNLAELSKVGQKVALEPYLQQGDQILGFAQRDFTTIKAGEAAQVIHTWVNSWRAGPAIEQVNISRGDKKMTLYVEFPEETAELLKLVRFPALAEFGNPSNSNVMEIVGIPSDLLQNVHTQFDSLPKGYREYLIPAERKRLEELTLKKKGTSEDIDWLKVRLLGEAIPSFQREADMIRSKVLELEPKLKENVASDVIYRKKGGKVEGQIIQETEEYVKVKSRFGAVSIPREDIEKVEKGKGAALEFPGKYNDAKGSLDKLVPLLAWCTEKSLKFEREYTAYVILTLDASNDKARTAVGLSRPTIKAGEGTLQPPKYPTLDTTSKLDPIDRTVEVIAADVVSRNASFSDVVNEMRRRTQSLSTTLVPTPPQKSMKGAGLIANPLTFKPGEMTPATAMEAGGWWSSLTAADRRDFAKYFGLWCAFTRGQK